jgi:hypothetical protein
MVDSYGEESLGKEKKAEMDLGSAGCAGHVQQLGSASLLPNLMEVKG